MSRSIEEISTLISRKASLLILQELPEPTCASKKQQWRWKVEQVKKMAAGKIWSEGQGLNIEIKV